MEGLRADLIGAHLLEPGDRAGRAWVLVQMRRTTLFTAVSAGVAAAEFSSQEWIDVPTAVVTAS